MTPPEKEAPPGGNPSGASIVIITIRLFEARDVPHIHRP